MKLKIVDWGDDACARTKEETGEASSEVVAEIEVNSFKGFSYDGGRLDIVGHPNTIWVMSPQWSIEVAE